MPAALSGHRTDPVLHEAPGRPPPPLLAGVRTLCRRSGGEEERGVGQALSGRRQEEFPEEYLWSGSKQIPDLLPDVLRCLSALNEQQGSEFWCPSISVIVKLLKHIQERSACPHQRRAIRGRQLPT